MLYGGVSFDQIRRWPLEEYAARLSWLHEWFGDAPQEAPKPGPVRMSSKPQMRAFFGGEGTSVMVR